MQTFHFYIFVARDKNECSHATRNTSVFTRKWEYSTNAKSRFPSIWTLPFYLVAYEKYHHSWVTRTEMNGICRGLLPVTLGNTSNGYWFLKCYFLVRQRKFTLSEINIRNKHPKLWFVEFKFLALILYFFSFSNYNIVCDE